MKVGDKVIWRNGKSRSKTVLPLGIANCEITDFGETHAGQKAASIKLPEGWPDIPGVDRNHIWVLLDDLEG
jgi:hypothetical protein